MTKKGLELKIKYNPLIYNIYIAYITILSNLNNNKIKMLNRYKYIMNVLTKFNNKTKYN